MVRRLALFGVVLGVMSVSIHGQVTVTTPLLGVGFATTLAIVLDVGALLALNEVLTTTVPAVRRWGWTALLLAAGLSVGLNVWHAVHNGQLPVVAAVAVGAVPVILAGVLSHLLAVSLAAERSTGGTSPAGTGNPRQTPVVPRGGTGTGSVPLAGTDRVVPDSAAGTGGGTDRVVPGSAGTGGGTDRVVPGSAGTSRVGGTGGGTGSAGTGVAPLRDVPPPVPIQAAAAGARRGGHRPARRELTPRTAPAARAAGQGVASTPVEGLPPAAAALWDKARDLDIRYRREHGEGLSRRRLMAEFGIGTSTAAPLHRALSAAGAATSTSTGVTWSAGTSGEAVPATGTGPTSPVTGTTVGTEAAGTSLGGEDTGTAAGTDADSTVEEPRARLALVGTGDGDVVERAGTSAPDQNSDQGDQDRSATEATGGGR